MADTIDVNISADAWTLGVANGKKGLCSNSSGSLMKYRKADSLPDASVKTGHTLRGEGLDDNAVNIDLTSSTETGNVYFRLVGSQGALAPMVFTEA